MERKWLIAGGVAGVLVVALLAGSIAISTFIQGSTSHAERLKAVSAESYNPTINPSEFTTEITNKYFSLPVGKKMVYEAETEDGLEKIQIEILDETKTIMGVKTLVFWDRVWLDGELIEDTRDYLAQDKEGNVWYFGEDVDNYEDGKLKDHAGAWIAGVDGAKPGIWMKANPQVGDSYRQEYYKGEAEDMAEVLATNETVTVPYGTFKNCVKTLEWTPLEPDLKAHKYYSPEVGGTVLEVELVGGERKVEERVELVDVKMDAEPTDLDLNLPIAPESERVDLYEPSFSDPTNITNPLFPVSMVTQTLLLGHVDGQPLHVEYTLLPGTKTIDWNGQQVETRIVQYIAHIDGRIVEAALDWYAQDDEGAVWYFGEDVFNYEDGVIADTEGTWLTGRDGPVAMIMPADPQVGDVYRVENIPGIVFEEVTVASIGLTVNGPNGPVDGAMIGRELHMDGAYSNKIFAPGYGEFVTTNRHELEAVALAVPTDALPGPLPAELDTLSIGAATIFDTAQSEDWNVVPASVDTMTTAWDTYQSGDVPIMLDAQMSGALAVLVAAVNARQPADVRQAAIDVAQASLDLQQQYRPPTEIDLVRFGLWTRQILVDTAADDPAAVTGDVATLEWIWDRIAHTLDSSDVSRINTLLRDLRGAADAEDLAAATDAAERLRDTLLGSSQVGATALEVELDSGESYEDQEG